MAASGELAFVLQTVIAYFYTHLTLTSFEPQPLTVGDPRPTQSSVYTKTYIADLSDHSPAVKL